MHEMSPVVEEKSSMVPEVGYLGVTEGAQRLRIAEHAEREHWTSVVAG